MKTEIDKEAMAANARLIKRRKEVTISIDPSSVKGPRPRTAEPETNFDAILNRLLESGRENKRLADEFKSQIEAKKFEPEFCRNHGTQLFPNLEASIRESVKAGRLLIVWHLCAQCFQIKNSFNAWKLAAGIPDEFMEATVDNWTPRNAEEIKHLADVRAFLKRRDGFLIMLGNRGTGKTHLSVGVIEHYRQGLLITQANLLYKLRQSYNDKNAPDIIEICQRAKVLVIDDMGLSVGGKDELPMLHEILSFRHSNFKPTVLTGNISSVELCKVIGERMTDRLQQSLAWQLIFTGASNRPARRTDYRAKT